MLPKLGKKYLYSQQIQRKRIFQQFSGIQYLKTQQPLQVINQRQNNLHNYFPTEKKKIFKYNDEKSKLKEVELIQNQNMIFNHSNKIEKQIHKKVLEEEVNLNPHDEKQLLKQTEMILEETLQEMTSNESKMEDNLVQEQSRKEQQYKRDIHDKQLNQQPNVKFYLGESRTPSGYSIEDVLSWRGQYKQLEQCHDYIQWLFPNHYKSRYNNGSFPLIQSEAIIFQENVEIKKRYIEGFDMFMNFLGIKTIFSENNKIIELIMYAEKEFYITLYQRTHNQLRIRRLLDSLTDVNLKQYTQELCRFLKFYAKGTFILPI